MKITKLKGGSLSKTSLVEETDRKYVVKEVSLSQEREYGFQRWYSQLKKLQRFEKLFPNLFPKLLNYGSKDGLGFFEIPYLEGYYNGYEYLRTESDDNNITLFVNKIIEYLNEIHSLKLTSHKGALNLYIKEEVEQKLIDAKKDSKFLDFIKQSELSFNGEKVKSFIYNQEKYSNLFTSLNFLEYETFTHGNITLGNLMYNPETKDLKFIDPYEENIIDHPFNEYSQLLQSSNSLYEFYDEQNVKIEKNKVLVTDNIPLGLHKFNNQLLSYLKSTFSDKEITLIHLFEISQFIRMLPFKSKKDFDKKCFFYTLASYKTQKLLDEVS